MFNTFGPNHIPQWEAPKQGFPTTLLVVLGVVLVLSSIMIISNMDYYGCVDDDRIRIRQFYDTRKEKEPLVVKIPEPPTTYKKYVAPKFGVLKLSKGIVTQTHREIKEDSVILVSRKNIDGRAGSFLSIQEIVPNEKFTIVSTNEIGEIEMEDFGEIYFQIV